DLAYQIATRFRMPLHDVRPGLVPLRCDGEEMRWAREIPGATLPVRASVGEVSFAENLLFTHRGLSGPVVLQISSFLGEDREVVIDLIPDQQERQLFNWIKSYAIRHPTAHALSAVRELMRRPGGAGFKRLADAWWSNVAAKGCGVPEDARFADISAKGPLRRLAKQLKHWRVRFDRTEGYPKAEVTCGGVGCESLSPESMEAKEWPGLFFVGESVDVTGWLGGYNLQWGGMWVQSARADDKRSSLRNICRACAAVRLGLRGTPKAIAGRVVDLAARIGCSDRRVGFATASRSEHLVGSRLVLQW
ncbi:unnamed protein product, partial [Prorocentrum cordatum]